MGFSVRMAVVDGNGIFWKIRETVECVPYSYLNKQLLDDSFGLASRDSNKRGYLNSIQLLLKHFRTFS